MKSTKKLNIAEQTNYKLYSHQKFDVYIHTQYLKMILLYLIPILGPHKPTYIYMYIYFVSLVFAVDNTVSQSLSVRTYYLANTNRESILSAANINTCMYIR